MTGRDEGRRVRRRGPRSRRDCAGAFRGLIASACILGSAGTPAQDLEPRAYANTPVGLNFLVAGFTYSVGDVAVDPALPLRDARLRLETGTLAFARSIDVLGRSAKFDVVVPYAGLVGDARLAGQPVRRDVAGLGDPRFRLSVNFFGAPAVTASEFPTYRQDVIVGASVYAWAPWGRYDPDRLVNLGTNRWTFKTELGISKAIGAWTLEFVPAVAFFTDNNDFAGGRTRAQDPVYSAQVHAIYAFRSGIWAALDGTYFNGGRTSVDGIPARDRQSNARVGLTVALPVDRAHSIKFYASTGVATRSGGDFDTFGIAWQYRWGAGYERLLDWRRGAVVAP